jgi:D-alanine-D-alanine ligase
MEKGIKSIAITAGGDSSEYPISIKSAQTILEHIDPEKYHARIVEITKNQWTVWENTGEKVPINRHDFSWQSNGSVMHFDAVYNAIHGAPGENGVLQAYFELLGMPYTGCDSSCSNLTFNKFYCNKFLQQSGVPVANSLFFRKGETLDPETIVSAIGLPCFVKPTSGGSSCGISKVNSQNDLQDAIDTAFAEDSEILIEQFLDGPEITCGMVNTPQGKTLFPLTEIVSKKEFFDYEAKYNPEMSEEITPARIPERIARSVQDLSAFIYDLLGCKGIVRMDYIIVDESPHFLEVNTIPGMTQESIVPQQASVYGLDLTTLISLLLDEALAR